MHQKLRKILHWIRGYEPIVGMSILRNFRPVSRCSAGNLLCYAKSTNIRISLNPKRSIQEQVFSSPTLPFVPKDLRQYLSILGKLDEQISVVAGLETQMKV